MHDHSDCEYAEEVYKIDGKWRGLHSGKVYSNSEVDKLNENCGLGLHNHDWSDK